MAWVPLLRDDETDATLWESNTIVRYLAAQYGQGRLWVENPARRAQGEKWMDWANPDAVPNPPRDPDGAYPHAGSGTRLSRDSRRAGCLRKSVCDDG